MAVVVTNNQSALKIKFDCGKDPITQKTISRTKSYSYIRFDASDEDCYDVASALAAVQSNTLESINKVDSSTLSA